MLPHPVLIPSVHEYNFEEESRISSNSTVGEFNSRFINRNYIVNYGLYEYSTNICNKNSKKG